DKDPALGLMESGNVYYVVKIDDNTIRLTSSKAAAQDAAPIDLTQAAGTDLGSGHSLKLADGTDGVTIHAGLEATNEVTTSTTISNQGFAWGMFIADAPAGNAEQLLGAVAQLGQKLAQKGAQQQPQAKTTLDPDASSFAIAGGVGVNYFTHDVEAVVGSTAHIKSNDSIKVSADISQYVQNSITTSASKPENADASASIALAVGIGLYNNTAKATVT